MSTETIKLPPKPNPVFDGWSRGGLLREDGYSAAQMDAYAQQAIALNAQGRELAAKEDLRDALGRIEEEAAGPWVNCASHLMQESLERIARIVRGFTQPAAVGGREPLSDERILHVWDGYVGYETGEISKRPLTDTDKLQFARTIEAAHGIHPTPKAGESS